MAVSPARIIGVDESGKGDFFGPLVIAAVLIAESDRDAALEMGIRDGKTIADKKLMGIDEQIRASYPHSLVILPPEEYNARWKAIRNLNILLAEGHVAAITGILKTHEADLAISDKFARPELIEKEMRKRKCTLPINQIVRGEALLAVAAASIVARAGFLRAIAAMSVQYGMDMPKGAGSPVDIAGRKFVQRYGVAELERVAKVHFKNFSRVAGLSLAL